MQDTLERSIQAIEAQIQRIHVKTSIFQLSIDMELDQCNSSVNPRELLQRYRKQLLSVQILMTKYSSIYSEYSKLSKQLKKELDISSILLELIAKKLYM